MCVCGVSNINYFMQSCMSDKIVMMSPTNTGNVITMHVIKTDYYM